MRIKLMVLAGVVVVGAVTLAGQAQRQPATLDDVVSELRALRADLQRTGGTTARMQLLTARLTLQEQRLGVLANQRQLVVTKLMEETRLRVEAEAQLARFTSNDLKNLPAEFPREQFDGVVAEFKRAVATHRDAEQQLRMQETQLSADIANEQNRWLDFNGRLDALERELK